LHTEYLLKLPKVCEHCGKAFEAKTVNTRFCSDACNNASLRRRKKQVLEGERKQQILECT
jgi:predicted nucleic acid-binding Zn ribbon protein